MNILVCATCGVVKQAQIDGYSVGGDVLADVNFTITAGSFGYNASPTTPADQARLEQPQGDDWPSVGQWLNKVVNFANHVDAFYCFECGGDVTGMDAHNVLDRAIEQFNLDHDEILYRLGQFIERQGLTEALHAFLALNSDGDDEEGVSLVIDDATVAALYGTPEEREQAVLEARALLLDETED